MGSGVYHTAKGILLLAADLPPSTLDLRMLRSATQLPLAPFSRALLLPDQFPTHGTRQQLLIHGDPLVQLVVLLPRLDQLELTIVAPVGEIVPCFV
jgi:hypothetical protein